MSSKEKSPMHFYVLSYNRGVYLKNCIASIEECVESPTITVFDDNSTDPETCIILESIAREHRVITPSPEDHTQYKCGGLYRNMQLALNDCPSNTLLCFIQDDTQIVRPLNDDDFQDIDSFFQKNASSCFLSPAFIRESTRKRHKGKMVYNSERQTYAREDSTQSAGVFFSAISIAHADRLKAISWLFEPKEKLNDKKAKRLNLPKMETMKSPFIMWLPNVPAYRGKIKTWALKKAEQLNHCGFYPYHILDHTENIAFRTRPASKQPYAENFLSLKNPKNEDKITKPWIIYPLENRRLLKKLNQAELFLRRLL